MSEQQENQPDLYKSVKDSKKFKKLKFKRMSLQQELDRFYRFVQSFNESDNLSQIKTRLMSITNLLSEFKTNQNEIDELLLMSNETCFDHILASNIREQFENVYYRAVAHANKFIESSNFAQDNPGCSFNHNTSVLECPESSNKREVNTKLPVLKLPEFSGKYSEWQKFHDSFQALIHNKPSLNAVEKFYYLLSTLKGEPAVLLSSIPVTEDGYSLAWDLLKKRYHDNKIIINAYLEEICNLPQVTKECHDSLRNLCNILVKNVNLLEALNVPVKTWDYILIHLTVKKLDFYSKREWENYSKDIDCPTFDDFTKFLNQRCKVLEATTKKHDNITKSNIKGIENKVFVASASSHSYQPICPFCKMSHNIYFCDKFKDLTPQGRYNEAVKLKLCTNCLRKGHPKLNCNSSGCRRCGKKHNTLLHREECKPTAGTNNIQARTFQSCNEATNTDNVSETIPNNVTLSNSSIPSKGSFILLPTALINVFTNDGKVLVCKVLLDSGSQSNFVSSSLLVKLGIRTQKVNIPVSGIAQIKSNISESVDICISSLQSNFKTKLTFLVVPCITEFTPSIAFDSADLQIPSEIHLADPNFNVPSDVEMLLGCDVFFSLLCSEQIRLGKNLPILQKTLLGWIVSGRVYSNIFNQTKRSECFLSQKQSIDFDLQNFWNLEEVKASRESLFTNDELICEKLFTNTITRNDSGRFIVQLPLKSNYTELGHTETNALNSLTSMERKFAKFPELKKDYIAFMEEYEFLGHMTEVSHNMQSDTPIYYLPHHSVTKPDSTTTKTRVVFNASSKSSTGLSLNDVLMVGPTIQTDLFSLLVRFRKHYVVFVGDLAKMYRQILVDERQRNLQRIFWRKNPNHEIKTYQLNTVTYGMASSSFLSTRCLLQIARENAKQFPRESEIIENDFYVDDLLTGAEDIQTLIDLKQNICKILKEYGFELRKFKSNEIEILKDDNSSALDHTSKKYYIPNDNITKTLGITWDSQADCFQYRCDEISSNTTVATKRIILSFISKFFDPLGLLGPISIRAKLLIQKLWRLNLEWDEKIPSDLESEWIGFKRDVNQIHLIQIPRCVILPHAVNIQVHGFSDASESAYACCLYLRALNSQGIIQTRLLCAKSRVAPLKSLTLPRLELLGSLLLSNLLSKTVSALKMNIDKIYLWTDSKIVLAWLSKEPRTWKTFIANRTAEIRQLTSLNDWNYIASEQNPADMISRGSNINTIKSYLWLNGPSFLSLLECDWPTNNCSKNLALNIEESIFEARKVLVCTESSFNLNNIMDRCSSYIKLVRAVAYSLRFISNLKTSKQKRQSLKHIDDIVQNYPLKTSEIEASETLLFKITQSSSFPEEISLLKQGQCINVSSKLKCLAPFLDSSGVMRVGGRLDESNIPYNHKHQIILPHKHRLTLLIVKHEHARALHGGAQTTLSYIRQKFWPINGRQIVKFCIRQCYCCYRAKPNFVYPQMGQLPIERVNPSRPFLRIGVDYAGPFQIKYGKIESRKLIKSYVCIFVCMATKAVHIELVSDLTSDGFLSVLKRFVSRRGLCCDIFSDNASYFLGSNNELIKLQALIHAEKIQNFLIFNKIKWHFIPGRSPTFGGLWEACIKSCKYHLKRVTRNIHLTYEEFYTLLVQIEAILNCRPLIALTSDLHDEVLTPAHFLIGDQLTAIPERNVKEERIKYSRRYRHLQYMGQQFWKKWSLHYLHHLQQRTKWYFQTNPQATIGSMVLLKEKNSPPMSWPLGRISDLHPGKDGVLRVVSVKTKNGVVRRALSQISLLPTEEDI